MSQLVDSNTEHTATYTDTVAISTSQFLRRANSHLHSHCCYFNRPVPTQSKQPPTQTLLLFQPVSSYTEQTATYTDTVAISTGQFLHKANSHLHRHCCRFNWSLPTQSKQPSTFWLLVLLSRQSYKTALSSVCGYFQLTMVSISSGKPLLCAATHLSEVSSKTDVVSILCQYLQHSLAVIQLCWLRISDHQNKITEYLIEGKTAAY